jgi:alkyldihydroxyacetonephosphate synthase
MCKRGDGGGGAVGSWREAFLRAPYLRDVFIVIGVLSETFETAITWERFPAFHERETADTSEAL